MKNIKYAPINTQHTLSEIYVQETDQNYRPAEDVESASDEMLSDHLCGSDREYQQNHHCLYDYLFHCSTMLSQLEATWMAEWL